MPEAGGKHIYLKLGSVDLGENELTSIKALVELLESQIECISTSSSVTLESAQKLDIKVSEFTNEIEAPKFEPKEEVTPEVTKALDHIFGNSESNQVEIKNELPSDKITVVKQEEDVVFGHKDEDSDDVKELKAEAENLPTLYIRRTVRSGQSIKSAGNIIIIGDVNPGAEIIAQGDITVWGILGGIAHAGSEGNNYARIRALKLNPVQIRIGEIFARRPDTVNMPYIQKTSEYTPEEAFAHNGSIVIRKIHEES
ncbi:septum site-determining protein MinC [bacterium]|nr:septum site-determining protein MinC [bacterium]